MHILHSDNPYSQKHESGNPCFCKLDNRVLLENEALRQPYVLVQFQPPRLKFRLDTEARIPVCHTSYESQFQGLPFLTYRGLKRKSHIFGTPR